MKLRDHYKYALKIQRGSFRMMYRDTLLCALIRLPFWTGIFLLFANITLKKHEDLTRICLFSFLALWYLLVMMPSRFAYGKDLRRIVSGNADQQDPSFRNGLLRALCGLPALPFVGGCAILWWGKNVSRINDFNKRVALLGESWAGKGADLQSRFTAGAALFALLLLAAGIIAFVTWNFSWSAELRSKNEKRFFRGIRGCEWIAVIINAGITVLSLIPAFATLIIYVADTMSNAGAGTMTRIMTLINMLGTLPPAWVIAAMLLDMVLLYLPLHLYRKIVCCILALSHNTKGTAD